MMSLRQQVLRGGAALGIREGAGLFLNLVGIVLLTRLIGPANYGLYAAAFALVMFLSNLGRLGVDVFLIRREAEPTLNDYHQASTILMLSSIVIVLAGWASLPLVERWYDDAQFVLPLGVLLLVLPLILMSAPAMAQLERALNFQAVAILELSGQALFYGVSLTLAAFGLGVWAPIAGYFAWQTWILVRSHFLTSYRPRFRMSKDSLREMLSYGLSFSAAMWIWYLRHLINPLLVGRILGPEMVAFIALGVRFAESLAFITRVTWRLSIAALSKVQGDVTRLRRAMEEAMSLQVLAVGPPLVVFTVVAPFIIPRVFGDEWSPVLTIFPFLAVAYMANAVFNMHSSVLFVLKHNRDVAAFHVAFVSLIALSSLILVPEFGLVGYGISEIIGFAAYAVIHARLSRIFSISYRQVYPWFIALGFPLFTPFVSAPQSLLLWAPLALLALFGRAQREQIRGYIRTVANRRPA